MILKTKEEEVDRNIKTVEEEVDWNRQKKIFVI